MTRWRFTPLQLALLLLVVLVQGATAWYAFGLWQVREQISGLEAERSKAQQNLTRLRGMDNVSAARQELETLRAKASMGNKPALPASIDSFQLAKDFVGVPPGSGTHLVNFKTEEPKAETIERATFRVLGFELSLRGNPYDLLGVLRRVDDYPLTNLKVSGFVMTRDGEDWTMKLNLAAYLLPATPAAAQAPSTPQASDK